MIRILSIEPMKPPEVKYIKPGLKAMQCEVGGYIEMICPFSDPNIAIFANEEGKITGLPLNRCLTEGKEMYDILAGTFFISALSCEGAAVSLSDEQIKTYTEMFLFPELFIKGSDGRIKCVKIKGGIPA